MRRRRLRGKKLLVASVAIGASSLLGCGDDPVANLVAPPEDSGMEEDAGDGMDAGNDAGDTGMDGGDGTDSAVPTDAEVPIDVLIFPDGPIANLVAPPPDSGPDAE